MALARTHPGWENEHLATFLLSRLAFVATPVTVGDDVGTDIFCTLYKRETRDGTELLVPRSSIAAQIKSSSKPFDTTPQLSYLEQLEVPYYIGAVDQRALTFDLYSARFLPVVLSMGRPARLTLVPVEAFDRHYWVEDASGGRKLLCHKVATLSAVDSREAIANASRLLHADAAAALQIIASRLNKEYVFDIIGGDVEIVYGSGSALTFRASLFKRLAKALYNLAWLSDRESNSAEVDAYLAVTERLEAIGTLPPHVRDARDKLLGKRASRGSPGTSPE